MSKGNLNLPFKEIPDKCFIAATRSKSKEASEKVPDIFPLQGEHRKPEHVHKPRKTIPPKNDVAPMGQLSTQIPQDIDVNLDIDRDQTPKIQQKAEPTKRKAFLSPTLFQPPKTTPFEDNK